MTEPDREDAPSPEVLRIPLDDKLKNSAPSASRAAAERLKPTGEAHMLTSVEQRPSQVDREPIRIHLGVQSQDLLALFDKAVLAAIAVGSRSCDPSDHVIAQELDDCLFELRILIENVKNVVPGQDSSHDGLKLLGTLEGGAASTFRTILGDLKVDLTSLLADSTDTVLDKFRVTCDSVKALIDQLDKLQDALVEEIRTAGRDVRNMLDEEDSNDNLSVLCFDGGGVRSYSSLMILKALMDEIRSLIRESQGDAITRLNRPCDFFDYVFGSSSGGLLAIMLARLKMTDEQCRDTFQKYAESIFSHPRLIHNVMARPKYSEKSLIRATKLVIGTFDPDPESQKWKRNMFAAPGEHCRCGVIAWAPSATIDVPYMFRTYDTLSSVRNHGKASDCQIWHVARATTAAPGYFPIAKIDGREFLDGGFGTNNPSHEALVELSKIHPTDSICLVSIGSGKRKPLSRFKFGGSLGRYFNYLQAAKRFVTDSAAVHEDIQVLANRQSEKLSYFRFDVPGLEDVVLDEWAEKRRTTLPGTKRMHTLTFIKRQTDEYLAQAETRSSIRQCAQMVVDSHCILRGSSVQIVAEPRVQRGHQVLQGFFRVPARNNLFYGRDDILEHMGQYLRPQAAETDPRLRYCVLSGLGGIGKTQIAAEYSYLHRHDYEYVFWVQASNEVELGSNYGSFVSDIVESRNATADSHTKEGIQTMRSWLSNTDATWLLVFDDVEDVKDITSYLPSSTKGSIIITTRRKDLEIPGSLRFSVEPLDSLSGAALLLKSIDISKDDGFDQAREISELLGGLPLAIVSVAGYMNMSQISLAEFLRLNKDRSEAFQGLSDLHNTTTWQYDRTLVTVFDTSLASLSTAAKNLLECMAILNPDEIPEELFLQKHEHPSLEYLASPDGMKARKLQTELLRISLITRHHDSTVTAFNLHRVLQRNLLQKLLSTPTRYVKVFLQAFYLIRAVIPHKSSSSTSRIMSLASHRPIIATYLPHVLSLRDAYNRCDQTLMEAEDRLQFVQLLSDTASSISAKILPFKDNAIEELYQEVIRTRSMLLDQKHPDTLAAMANLGSVYRDQGRLKEAEALQVQVAESSKQILGPEHPDTLNAMASLALTYRTQGRLEEAEALQVGVTESFKKIQGGEHPDTLAVIAGLALTYRDQKRGDEALILQERVLESFRRALGEEHPATLNSKIGLALIYQDQGRFHKAIDLLERVVDIQASTLPRYNLDLLESERMLANAFLATGQFELAVKLLESVVKIQNSTMDASHQSRLASQHALACAYHAIERPEPAALLLDSIIALPATILAEDHPQRLASQEARAKLDI